MAITRRVERFTRAQEIYDLVPSRDLSMPQLGFEVINVASIVCAR